MVQLSHLYIDSGAPAYGLIDLSVMESVIKHNAEIIRKIGRAHV